MQDKRKWLLIVVVVLLMALSGGTLWWSKQRPPLPPEPVKKAPAQQNAPHKTEAQSAQSPESGIPVQPITEITPRTVYSGNLATLTGIQAGTEINKAKLEFAQVDAKIQKLQQEMSPTVAPVALPALPNLPGQPAGEQPSSSPRIVVLSVRGAGGVLSATLRTKSGTHTVRVGDAISGFGKIQSITRDQVILNGSAIPWT